MCVVNVCVMLVYVFMCVCVCVSARVCMYGRACVCVMLVCVCVNALNSPVFLTFHPEEFKAKCCLVHYYAVQHLSELTGLCVKVIINNNSAHSSIPQPIM